MHGRRRYITVIAIVLLVCAACAVIYPLVSDYFARQQHAEIVLAATNTAASATPAQLLAEKDAARRYNKALLDATETVTRKQYDALCNLSGDGIIGVLKIPSIDVSLPIYHSVDTDVLKRGVGHIYGSSLPVGGIGSHAALSGHSGMQGQRMLSELEQMEIGDYFLIYVLGETLVYQTTQIKTVLPDDVSDLNIEAEKDSVTLITCTPFGINTHRLLVRGERVSVPDEQIEVIAGAAAGKPSTWMRQYLRSLLSGIGVAAVIIGVYAVIYRRRRKNNV